MEEAKLRFGVMCHGTSFEAWQARCLRQLMELPGGQSRLRSLLAGRSQHKVEEPVRGGA